VTQDLHPVLARLAKPQPFILQLIIACRERGVDPLLNSIVQAMAGTSAVEALTTSQVLIAVTFLRQAQCLEREHDQPLRATDIGREAVKRQPKPNRLSEVVDAVIRIEHSSTRITKKGR
jgi:hypothetical protein